MSVEKLPTGVPGLDILTHGGIPHERSTLIVGRSGTGKTVLSLQAAASLAKSGHRTILIAVEETPEDLTTTGDGLGLDITGLCASGSLIVKDFTRPMDGPIMVSGDYDVSGLLHRLEALVRDTDAKVVVVDSATALFSHPRPPQELLRSSFSQLVHALRRLRLTSVILAEAAGDYGQLTSLGVEDYVCDLVLILRNLIDGDRRRRSIEVHKYRRSAHYKGEYPCTITARGIAVFPLDATEQPHSREVTRYSAGFPGLDQMIGGGLLRDSIAIVRGPTGSGKTMLAGLYARAGAARGERVVYYGFEEPRAILLRNFSQIGMEMEGLEASDNLRFFCRYPESLSLEDLLVSLRMDLEEFKPSLVVLDSISAIEHASSEKGFRQFMIGMASILRQHGRSALLTQTVVGGNAAGHAAPYLSTIADMILALDYTADRYDMERTLRVVKMRGSAHETHPYSLTIAQGGLSVGPMSEKERASFDRA